MPIIKIALRGSTIREIDLIRGIMPRSTFIEKAIIEFQKESGLPPVSYTSCNNQPVTPEHN